MSTMEGDVQATDTGSVDQIKNRCKTAVDESPANR